MSKELNKAPVEQAGGDERAAQWHECTCPKIGEKWNPAKHGNDCPVHQARAALAQPSPAQAEQPTADDYEEVLADHRRLVREMDVLLNGEACAAKQAMLCDLVSQVEAEVRKSGQPLLVSAERYRWLRNDDNWGADDSEGQGTSKWANLGELSGTDFDAYLDQLRGSNPVMDIDPEHSKAIAKRGRDAIVAQAEGFTRFPELLESVQQMDAMLKANSAQADCIYCQGSKIVSTTDTDHNGDHIEMACPKCTEQAEAEAERPEVVGSAWRNIYNNGFDHVAPFPPAPGGPVVDEPLMTVAQHAASVARWAEMFNRVEQERDAALARVAELEEQEPVAWVEVIDRDYGPYNFHGKRLLPKGKHQLYAAPVAQAQHSVPEGWMLVECGIWTQEQVDEMQKTVARFRNSEFVDDRALAMAVADAGQCKAPEISLAELLAAAPGKDGV